MENIRDYVMVGRYTAILKGTFVAQNAHIPENFPSFFYKN